MTEKFDPRFDPRFQPGYLGEPGGSASAPLPTEPAHTVSDTAATCEVRSGDADLQGPLPVDEVRRDDGDGDGDEHGPNPFERTLWVVAAVFVVAGAAAAFWANSQNFYGEGSSWLFPQMFQSSAWALSGPMVTVGLAIGVGLLFRRAISWKPWE